MDLGGSSSDDALRRRGRVASPRSVRIGRGGAWLWPKASLPDRQARQLVSGASASSQAHLYEASCSTRFRSARWRQASPAQRLLHPLRCGGGGEFSSGPPPQSVAHPARQRLPPTHLHRPLSYSASPHRHQAHFVGIRRQIRTWGIASPGPFGENPSWRGAHGFWVVFGSTPHSGTCGRNLGSVFVRVEAAIQRRTPLQAHSAAFAQSFVGCGWYSEGIHEAVGGPLSREVVAQVMRLEYRIMAGAVRR